MLQLFSYLSNIPSLQEHPWDRQESGHIRHFFVGCDQIEILKEAFHLQRRRQNKTVDGSNLRPGLLLPIHHSYFHASPRLGNNGLRRDDVGIRDMVDKHPLRFQVYSKRGQHGGPFRRLEEAQFRAFKKGMPDFGNTHVHEMHGHQSGMAEKIGNNVCAKFARVIFLDQRRCVEQAMQKAQSGFL